MIVLTAALAASITQTELPAQSVPSPAPAAVSAPVLPASVPADPVPVAETPIATSQADQTPPPPRDKSEIVVSGEHKMQKIDPIEGVNKLSFETLETVDKALIGPIMYGYRDGVPSPIRQGLHNFLFNLTEPVNALNHVLQLHPGRALRTLARFGINSTIGIAGVLDVAKKKPFKIIYRPNGFGNTFGYWGIGPGPYLFVPLVGPTSLRDLIGSIMDQAALPLVVKPLKNFYYVTAAGVITELDYRVDIDAGVQRVRKTSNVYASYRKAYFRSRFEEIEALHGRGPLAEGEIGQPPFVEPLHPKAPEKPAEMPAPAVIAPVPAAPVADTVSVPPAQPLPPVFVSQPVVQPLPSGYRPGGS